MNLFEPHKLERLLGRVGLRRRGRRTVSRSIAYCTLIALCALTPRPAETQVIVSQTPFIDIHSLFTPGYVTLENASIAATGLGPFGNYFRVNFGATPARFRQSFAIPKDLSSQDILTLHVTNHETRTVNVSLLFQVHPDPNNFSGSASYQLSIPAGQTVHYLIVYGLPNPAQWNLQYFPRPYDTPYTQINVSSSFNRASIYHWRFSMTDAAPASLTFSNYSTLVMRRDVNGLADEWFQYAWRDWPGKVRSVNDLWENRMSEEADLGLNPPVGEYSGTTILPNQGASTRWRIGTIQGKKYFIHPSGRPFWSLGLQAVHDHTSTWIDDREYMFQWLPSQTGPFADCYTTVNRLPGQGGGTVTAFKNFRYVLRNKYGDNYEAGFRALSKQRLLSWGFNTVGTECMDALYDNTVPYVVQLDTRSYPNTLATPVMHWSPIPDPYHADFEPWMSAHFGLRLAPHNGRSFFLGAFVDNEMSWGHTQTTNLTNRYSIAVGAFAAPYSQPAKAALITFLTTKYQSVALLNQAWGTSYPNWNTLRNPLTINANAMSKAMTDDIREYTRRFAATYFSKVKNALASTGFTGLYLGCRFWHFTPEVVAGAVPHVDVFSFNNYAQTAAYPWSYLNSLAKPVMISEWSNPINARGSVGWNQQTPAENGAEIVNFLQTAARQPNIVGVQWFKYNDFPVTGAAGSRWNVGMGILDSCDQPKPEVVEAFRTVGRNLYQVRSSP